VSGERIAKLEERVENVYQSVSDINNKIEDMGETQVDILVNVKGITSEYKELPDRVDNVEDTADRNRQILTGLGIAGTVILGIMAFLAHAQGLI
jgi:tetrahydromethanopterin S-methyltransferase subunit B